MEEIRPVRDNERILTGFDLFLLWIGAAISLAEVWAGGMLAPLGLGMGILVIILGHVIGNTPFALGGIIGNKYGIPSMVTLRPSFGVRGSYLGSILNVVQLIGWTAVMLFVAGDAAYAIYSGIDRRLWIILIGIVTTLWAIGGSRYWKWAGRIGVLALAGVCVVATYSILKEGIPGKSPSGMDFGLALDLVIAMPVSWLPLVSDYSRYSKSVSGAFWGTWFGYMIGSSWMYALGLMAFLSTGSTDVISVMVKLGFTGLALILVLLSTVTTTFLDLYSAAVSFMNFSSRFNRNLILVIAGIIGIAIALVFPPGAYEGFLLLIGGMFCPIFGVVLADYFILRKGIIKVEDLYKMGEGIYWYNGGVNWWAVFCWALGFVLYEIIALKAPWIGASIPSMVVAGLVYLLKRG
ncbi:MAG: putative hydroxymethylpyrimidine transporter CytX [Synergistetes bacterium]|nr:putative hydroxymethylpyrimidine transporter CytX [Synergistota bacterium]MCX8128336.1 putative hydroxymethylpyrimidine transporter CytX [Synergistota bacterium]MDW8193005.1 putative hydroxymethylpyrimidine transporter CytX [Synergistota bacterium]